MTKMQLEELGILVQTEEMGGGECECQCGDCGTPQCSDGDCDGDCDCR